jgi:hypothetical protein
MGQKICAKKIKEYVAVFAIVLSPSGIRFNHKKPSENCCIAKIKGIQANGTCFTLLVFLIEITPIVDRTVAAVKLAVAEKHISLD